MTSGQATNWLVTQSPGSACSKARTSKRLKGDNRSAKPKRYLPSDPELIDKVLKVHLSVNTILKTQALELVAKQVLQQHRQRWSKSCLQAQDTGCIRPPPGEESSSSLFSGSAVNQA